MDYRKEYTPEGKRIMFEHYSRESITSLLGRICDSEFRVPGLAKEGKLEDIKFIRENQTIIVRAILYHQEEELQNYRRKLQLEIQAAKSLELNPPEYRSREKRLYILNDILYDGVITQATLMGLQIKTA